MTQDPLHETLYEIAHPLAASLGLRIWGLEFARGKRSLLRVYVENAAASAAAAAGQTDEEAGGGGQDVSGEQHMSAEQGVSIEQCAKLSRSLGLALDVEDIIPGAYTLEVSSPGMSRPFFSLQQLQAYTGELVEVTLGKPLLQEFPGRKTFRGRLQEVAGDTLRLEMAEGDQGAGQVVALNWQDLKKARLSPDIAVPAASKEKKGGKKKKKSKKS